MPKRIPLGLIIKEWRAHFPHLSNRASCARRLDTTSEHLCRIENGDAWPSGDLLERINVLMEFPPVMSARMWEELAIHQLDPIVGRWVKVSARKKRKG